MGFNLCVASLDEGDGEHVRTRMKRSQASGFTASEQDRVVETSEGMAVIHYFIATQRHALFAQMFRGSTDVLHC